MKSFITIISCAFLIFACGKSQKESKPKNNISVEFKLDSTKSKSQQIIDIDNHIETLQTDLLLEHIKLNDLKKPKVFRPEKDKIVQIRNQKYIIAGIENELDKLRTLHGVIENEIYGDSPKEIKNTVLDLSGCWHLLKQQDITLKLDKDNTFVLNDFNGKKKIFEKLSGVWIIKGRHLLLKYDDRPEQFFNILEKENKINIQKANYNFEKTQNCD